MSSDAMLSSPVIINKGDGSELRFKRLAPSDHIELQNAFVTFRKLKMLENRTLLKVSHEAKTRALDEFDAKRVKTSDVDEWINTLPGQMAAMRLSLAKDKAGATSADVDALGLSRGEMLEAAAKVCGLGIVPVDREGREKMDPLTGGGTGDGSTTPPASATG